LDRHFCAVSGVASNVTQNQGSVNPADEIPFRIAFGVFWALNLALRIYFRTQAKATDRSFRKHEQREKLLSRVFAFAFIFMLVYIFSTWIDFAHIAFPVWARWILGGGILLAHRVLLSWSHYALGRNWSGVLQIHRDHTLITNGPYRYVRHPMYSASFLSGIGVFLLSANWLIAAIYMIVVTFIYLNRVSLEEEMMIERFGDSYQEYMKKTGRLLPRLRS
jgi:protein-S-isoprenylcysteine O-methyltransferase Ste14